MRHVLFPLAELEPGTIRAAKLDNVEIAVVRTVEGEVYALRDVCPHRGARLSWGTLTPLEVADDVGERRRSDRWVVRCPWHGFEFDAATGRCPADPDRVRVRTYTVTIEDDVIVIER